MTKAEITAALARIDGELLKIRNEPDNQQNFPRLVAVNVDLLAIVKELAKVKP